MLFSLDVQSHPGLRYLIFMNGGIVGPMAGGSQKLVNLARETLLFL